MDVTAAKKRNALSLQLLLQPTDALAREEEDEQLDQEIVDDNVADVDEMECY